MRCFGIKKKVIDCDWEYLKTLRTLQAPHEPMPRLIDVLEYLSQPGREDFWILLDIKVFILEDSAANQHEMHLDPATDSVAQIG